MKSPFGIVSLVLLMASFAAAVGARTETGFLNRELKTSAGTFRYQVFVPAGWTRANNWPVILFLHGAGERGDDGILQTEVGFGAALRRHAERFPCIVVMPQCRKDKWWSDPQMEQVAVSALDLAIKEFKGDKNRIYLTGISMGGYGSWDIAQKYPGRFAALAPICGGIVAPPSIKNLLPAPPTDDSGDPYLTAAKKVARIPIWIFHGGADPVVPPSESRKMAAALKSLNANARYTEYPGVPHNSWDKAYSEPDFPLWLLSQKLKSTKKR